MSEQTNIYLAGGPRPVLAPSAMRWLLVALLLLLGPGCTQKSDWVAETLVTVDVSGVWEGRLDPTDNACCSGGMTVTLAQLGPKVTGTFTWRRDSAPIEGTVRGDILSLATVHRGFTAELTVAGDE